MLRYFPSLGCLTDNVWKEITMRGIIRKLHFVHGLSSGEDSGNCSNWNCGWGHATGWYAEARSVGAGSLNGPEAE